MEKNHILIVDDDTRLRQLLKTYLQRNNFITSECANANETEDFLALIHPDAIIMDMMMPEKNGDILIKELRQKGINIPILMLTAKGDPSSRINGLEAGADDYLSKPFEPKELLLRLNNLLKRTNPAHTKQMVFGPFCYNTQLGILTKENTPISLTSVEQKLLEILLNRINQTVSREELSALLELDNERSADVQITRLRKKLEQGETTQIIQTIRGKGYRLISA